jgi:hypothetical protein
VRPDIVRAAGYTYTRAEEAKYNQLNLGAKYILSKSTYLCFASDWLRASAQGFNRERGRCCEQQHRGIEQPQSGCYAYWFPARVLNDQAPEHVERLAAFDASSPRAMTGSRSATCCRSSRHMRASSLHNFYLSHPLINLMRAPLNNCPGAPLYEKSRGNR